MNRLKFILAFFISIMLVTACNTQINNKYELQQYSGDSNNGLIKEEKKGNIITTAHYIPYQLMFREPLDNGRIKSSIIHTNPSKIYFSVHFSKDGKELLTQLNMDMYSEILQTLSFRMTPFVSIRTDDGHELSPLDCFFQQTYGFSSNNELLLIFDSAEILKSEKYDLSITEFGLGIGDLTYSFLSKDIEKLNRSINL